MAISKPEDSSRSGRRSFLTGLSAALVAASTSPAQQPAQQPAQPIPDPLRVPDSVTVFAEERSGGPGLPLTRSGSRWQANDVEITTEVRQEKQAAHCILSVTAPKTRLTRIRLRWRGAFPSGSRFLGDHWERTYGDVEWRGFVAERFMPWYFLAFAGGLTHGYGVMTGAASICYWQADEGGVTLWLDVSNGGSGVELGDRRLEAATVVFRKGRSGESPQSAATAFCGVMCEKPLLAPMPVYGSNNWYYAYGRNVSAEASLRDATLMAELMPSKPENRPFVVIDMGWGNARNGAGPVSESSKSYPDMPGLARQMKDTGVRPGLWTRPTLTSEKRAESWRLPAAGGRPRGALICVDPTIPEALAYIGESIATIGSWGYELIKHDFSTFDLTGRWGFEMGPDLTERGWHFNDRSKTTAEVILDVYRTIRRNAGGATVLGCNTIGHLAAGLVEAQRIGDDTSGREWPRTRKMGVNTLAFRMPQHNTFFAADADCVAITRAVPWKLTRQWLDLVARSGTALFLSPDPAAVTAENRPALRQALAEASRPHEPGVPVDWMETTTPARWRLDGKLSVFNWYDEG